VLLMVGDGAERERLARLQAERGLTNVVMLHQQPKERMPEIWALSDASLVLLKKMPLFETVIPSKIFESMAMAKPIILGVGGEAKEIVEEARAGVTIEPENADALAAAVLQLAQDLQRTRALGASGRAYVIANFDRHVQARRYEAVLTELRAPHASAALGVRTVEERTGPTRKP